MTIPPFVFSSVDGHHLGCLHFGAIVENAAEHLFSIILGLSLRVEWPVICEFYGSNFLRTCVSQ